jgi:hypothetical protein
LLVAEDQVEEALKVLDSDADEPTEACGYAPSSRLASRPPELSALIPYL